MTIAVTSIKTLNSFSIIYVTAEWLDSLQVYVGNCRPDDVSDNTVCKADIGDVANGATAEQAAIIEVTCDDNVSYGRYVYLIPDVDTNPFQICEVRVYGSDSRFTCISDLIK